MAMERIEHLLAQPAYGQLLAALTAAEETRAFCRHGFDHSLAVARIAYILSLEGGGTEAPKEVIYAAALLHDLGRVREYQTGGDHALWSQELARPLLTAAGFSPGEIQEICNAIGSHRSQGGLGLGGLLYRADKLSRDCRDCASRAGCHWLIKNETILY